MTRWTLIRRRGARRTHLYNGRSDTHSLTLCGQQMRPGNAVLSYTNDADRIGCEDCFIYDIRLAIELKWREYAELALDTTKAPPGTNPSGAVLRDERR